MKKWKPEVGMPVEIYEDPMTEHVHEGVGQIVKIHNKTSIDKKYNMMDCDVRFYNDFGVDNKLGTEVYRRQIKYQK